MVVHRLIRAGGPGKVRENLFMTRGGGGECLVPLC